jgi:hypothetical protein
MISTRGRTTRQRKQLNAKDAPGLRCEIDEALAKLDGKR